MERQLVVTTTVELIEDGKSVQQWEQSGINHLTGNDGSDAAELEYTLSKNRRQCGEDATHYLWPHLYTPTKHMTHIIP